MIRALTLTVLLLLAACNKAQPAKTGDPAAAAIAEGVAAPAPSTPSPAPDLSGEPVVGTVESAQGAARIDPPAAAPPAK